MTDSLATRWMAARRRVGELKKHIRDSREALTRAAEDVASIEAEARRFGIALTVQPHTKGVEATHGRTRTA